MHMTHTGLEEDMFMPDEPMPFNDRPYFRRLLDFDDLVRRKGVIDATSGLRAETGRLRRSPTSPRTC